MKAVSGTPSASNAGCLRSVGRSLGSRLTRSSRHLNAGRSCGAAAEGGKIAGFAVQDEVSAIQVSPENVAPYSLPQEVLTYEPCADAVKAVFKNGDSERTVHCHVELTAEEQQKLEVMRAVAEEEDVEFLPSIAAAASRFLARARGDPRRALREMATTQEWRLSYFKDGPILDTSIEEDLSLGIVYFAGRDRWLRPALVVRPARIPASWHKDKRVATDKLVRLLVFCIEYMIRFMLLPGRVEGGVVLVDMSGLTSTQVPFGPLKSIISVMANHYVNRIFRFYMLNLPTALSMSAQLGMRFLTDRQRQKMQIVKDVQELRQEFALHQLEEDFGGSRPIAEQFFPFTLPAGPFEAGASEGPRPDAIPGVHLALTTECLQGRPWDCALSREENRRLQYTPAAADILAGQLAQADLLAPTVAAASPEEMGEPRAETPITALDTYDVDPRPREGLGEESPRPCSEQPGSDDSEASHSDDRETSQVPPLPPCGSKDAETASLSTGDGFSSSPAATEELSRSSPDSIVLEDSEVRPGKSLFCMPFQCRVSFARTA